MHPIRRRNRHPCDACKRRKTGCYRNNSLEPCTTCQIRRITCVTGNFKRGEGSPNSTNSALLEVISGGPHAAYDIEETNDGELAFRNLMSPLDVDGSDFKSLFVGFSGDNNPWLLRKFQDTNASVEIPRKEARSNMINVARVDEIPTFFSIFPRRYLDSRPGEYCIDAIEKVVGNHSKELFDTYFTKVHPHFPIFSRLRFESQYKSRKITATLLSVLYLFSSHFYSDIGDLFVLEDFLAKAVPLEARAATLQTVLCMLLYLQLPPGVIREPNFPGHWALTASLVAQAQELGLNIDCSNWSILLSEKRERKKLWWGIFIQDKWGSLGLSRPSHIGMEDFNVPKLDPSDFEDVVENSSAQDITISPRISCFLGLCDLSIILSRVLVEFYSVRAIVTDRTDFSKALILLNEINHVQERISGPYMPIDTCFLSFLLCTVTLKLAICRNFLGESESYALMEPHARDAISSLISGLKKASIMELARPWWSYSRVNFALVGSILISIYVARTPAPRYDWLSYIREYRDILTTFSKVTQITQLAHLRYENLLAITKVLKGGPIVRSLEPTPVPEMPSAEHIRDTLSDPELFFEWISYMGI